MLMVLKYRFFNLCKEFILLYRILVNINIFVIKWIFSIYIDSFVYCNLKCKLVKMCILEKEI